MIVLIRVPMARNLSDVVRSELWMRISGQTIFACQLCSIPMCIGARLCNNTYQYSKYIFSLTVRREHFPLLPCRLCFTLDRERRTLSHTRPALPTSLSASTIQYSRIYNAITFAPIVCLHLSDFMSWWCRIVEDGFPIVEVQIIHTHQDIWAPRHICQVFMPSQSIMYLSSKTEAQMCCCHHFIWIRSLTVSRLQKCHAEAALSKQ